MPYVTDEEYLELLEQRVRFWKDDDEVVDLFMKMYTNLIECGCYEDGKHSVMEIVDNDVVNWCDIIYKDDTMFNTLIEAYKNCDYEIDGYCIEAIDDEDDPTMILVRS